MTSPYDNVQEIRAKLTRGWLGDLWQLVSLILQGALWICVYFSSSRFYKTHDSYEGFMTVISLLLLLYLKGERHGSK